MLVFLCLKKIEYELSFVMEDVLKIIFANVFDVDARASGLVCTQWHRIMKKQYPWRLHRLRDAFILFDMFPDKEWDYSELCCGEEFPWELIIVHLSKPWNWSYLSYHAPIELVRRRPDLPWNWSNLSSDIMGITRDDLCNPSLLWEMYELSRRQDMVEFAIANQDFAWDWREMSWITDPSIVEKNPSLPWNWIALSGNNFMTIEFVEMHPEFPWNHKILLSNIGIAHHGYDAHRDWHWNWDELIDQWSSSDIIPPLSAIKDNPYRNWSGIDQNAFTLDQLEEIRDSIDIDTGELSYRSDINFNDVMNRDLPWEYDYLGANLNIDPIYVIQNPHLPWNWYLFSDRSDITPELIKSYPDIPWDMEGLSLYNWDSVVDAGECHHISHDSISRSKCVSWDMVNSTMNNIRWNWKILSFNRMIRWQDIADNPDHPWDWSVISSRY